MAAMSAESWIASEMVASSGAPLSSPAPSSSFLPPPLPVDGLVSVLFPAGSVVTSAVPVVLTSTVVAMTLSLNVSSWNWR